MTSAGMINTAERRAFVLALRKAGHTYRAIAQRTIGHFGLNVLPAGWDERYAYKDVARELDRLANLRNGLTEDVQRLELERLDALLEGLWGRAQMGKTDAVDRVLRIMERRARLLGLDAPTRQEHSGKDGGAIVIDLSQSNISPEDI